MKIDEKILNEIARYKSINNYIMEQDVPPPVEDPALAGGAGAPPAPDAAGATPPPAPPAGEPIDLSKDPDVEELSGDGEEGTEGEGETEELDITDLVD